MNSQGIINNIRAKRLDDELVNDAPIQLPADIKFPSAITQSPFSQQVTSGSQGRLKVTRLTPTGNKYRITGGYFEYTPVIYQGQILDSIDLDLPPETRVYLQTTMRWDYASYPYTTNAGAPFEESGRIYYLTGAFTVKSAEVIILPFGTPLPASRPSQTSTDESLVNKDDVQAPGIATILADGRVVSSELLHLVYGFAYPGESFSLLNVFH